MEGHGRRPSSFHPPSQQPPYPHLQPQQLDPNLLLLQNLGTYLQNNPSLLSPFNNPNLSNNPFFPQNPNFVPTTPLYPNPNQYHTPFPNFSQPQNPNPNPNNSAPKEQRQSSTPNRIVNNPKFPVNRKPTISNERLELLAKIEAAVVSARREFIEAGENVSALKVSESVLLKLQVDSWESLGYQLQEIPSLHSLIITEGKINAFINCYVAVHKITSLFDLQMAICKNEGVKTFEELELGPFVRQPLVVHYFSVNKDVKGVYKITGEEIVSYLSEFFDARKHKSVKIEEFLEFIAKKCQVTSWERLGVRIQSLGMHIAFLREAHASKDLVLKKCMEMVKEKPTRPSNKRSLFTLQKQQLDDRFSAITERVASFASVNKEFCGRHIRFVSSSSDEDIDATDSSDSEGKGDVNVESNQCQLSSLKRKSGDRVSSCPYPSVAEEMTRLGLRSEKQECSSSSNKNLKGQKTSEPAKKRRKLKSLSHGRAIKQNSFFRRGGTETQEENNRNSVDLSCANDSIRMFITTWKEACREHTASEVFEKILQFHKMSVRQQKRLQSLFSAYPLLGLLNVAVTSIKNGMWDSMYDTFQLIGELGQANAEGNKHYESIDVEPVEKAPAVSKEAQKSSPCVKVDDVMRKVSEYLAENAVLAGGNSLLDVVLMFSRQLCHCEVWLAQQFSVKEFKLLGHGDFFSFLRSHASLIPKELLEFVGDRAQEPQSLEASILQQQLAVLVSQASSNLWEDNAVTKEKISELLMRQFPFISFKVVGMKGVEELLDTVRQHRNSITSSCVVFSSTLLGTSDNTELVPDAGQMINNLGSVTTKEAVEILLKAPFLLDLNTWSHWDHVYAPTLGPLLKWLLTEANAEGLLCVLTRDAKIIRIDPLASVDMFFQALLQESPLGIAVQLLSLFVLSGGRRHVPMSLLKCQARQAFEVIMANSMQKYDTNGDQSGDKTLKELKFDEAAGRSSSFVLSKSLRGIDGAVAFVSRIFIDCLGFLPSEFRWFASEILFSGLQSVVKDVASAVLCQCKGIEERLMLHDIGFSLGIVEWTHDHNSCCPITDNYSVIAIQPSPLICMGSYAKGLESTEYPALKNSSVAPHQDEHCKTHDEISNHLGSPLVDSGEVISHRSTDKDIDEQKEAARLIESIRREEFGLDPSISDVESSMLKKQHARLGRALNCLSQELYSQDSHFLLELVQNADDNVYPDNVEPTLTFILQHSGIVVLNNEKGFTSRNIRALCDVGNSTKKGSSVGYIGQKGIGFKSVFRVTDAPEIHSNGFHIKFDISEGQIGFVLPSIVSPCNIEMYKKLAYESDHPKGGSCWNTCILLPFKSKLLEGLAINCILSMFSDLHPSLLLFLHRLQCIKLRNMLNDSLIVMRKEVLGDGIIRVSHGKKKMTWFVASNKLLPKVFRSNVQTTEISIALTLNETEHGDYEAFLDQQPVFAFLPLRTYGLKFILQADFILPSSREEVDGDSPWNQWLLSEFPGLFVDAEKSFCALPCFQQNPAKAVTAYMSFVPLMGEVHGFFSGLPRMIISKLRQSNCLLQDGYKDKWVPPCKVLRGWNEQAQRLLSDSLLYEHLGLGFLDKDISLSDALARALGVEEYGPRILVRVISSLGCLKDGIKSMGLGWLLSWINELYNMFHSYAPNLRNSGLEQDLLNSLKKVPFIPLSDGSYGSLEEGAIWFHSNYISAGVDQIGNETFPHLHATLRVVSHALFSEAASDVALVNNCTRMLQRIGVQQMSAHDLIRNHILPSISDGKLADKDQQLMTDYAAFIMFHLQSNCGDCHVESEQMFSELRSKAIILTNYGYQRPFEVSIHFSGEYGNSVDSNKFIHALDYKWHEVDPMYLEHPVTKSCGLVKWREFLQKLGVTDFVKVVMVEKSVADLSSNVLNQMMCHGDLVSSGLVVKDWESSELFHILSLLAKDGSQDKCRYFLEVLDTLWDDHFSDKVSGSCSSISGAKNIFFKSSLMQCISEIRWISSSFDSELHYPTELFYDCDAVRSILGSQAAYAVPKIRSTKLLSEIGFKTQVTLDDALLILRSWQRSESPFTASLLQMSRLYTFIWKEMTRSRQQVVDALDSRPFIFVPYGSVKIHEDIVAGLFLSPGEVYWNDSTGALDCSTDVKFSVKTTNSLMSKTLCTVYPGLHDFFVTECGVNEDPPLRQYLQILQQLSRNALPFEAANTVFKVFLKWSDGLKNGALSSDDMSYLKNCLSMSEFTVLPTLQDKWVSLHSSFGLVCWCDDDMLKKEFKYSDNIEFLYFGVLTDHEKEMLYRKVSVILQNIGIPALSKIVSREAIYYGPVDCGFKTSMIGWVLPFAQRYIYNLHPEKYGQFKHSGFSELHLLRIIVVEKLFYRNVIKRCDCASKKRSECSSLLQGNVLYTTRESDSHSIFMELSRLFFDGTSELHLANFLHMIATMAESGSTEEQIEFFILHSQKMAKLPEDESVWFLSSPAALPENDEMVLANALITNMNEHTSVKSKKKPGCSSWPPADWKTAPGFNHSRENMFRTQAAITDLTTILGESDDHFEEEKADATLTEISEDVIEDVLLPSVEIQPDGLCNQPQSSLDALADPTNVVVESISPEEGQSKSSGRDHTPGAQQAMLTGRLGELVAFRYFAGKFGGEVVNWVNQDKETGLPYDIVVGEEEESIKYFEVKASRYAKKDWFVISTREWQFAAEKGDSFSIAHVILNGQNLTRITIYKNPVKLCQLGKLQLAVMTPRLYQEPIHPSSQDHL